MKNIKVIISSVAIFVLACVCGSTPDTVEKIGEVTQASDTTAPQATSAPAFEIYKAGDIITTGQTNITLNTAEYRGNVLYANFTIENISNEEVSISSLLLFEAKSDDGTKLEQEIFDCETSLDGSILPGDKLKGSICWSNATTNTAKIYFSPLFSGQTIVWEVTR